MQGKSRTVVLHVTGKMAFLPKMFLRRGVTLKPRLEGRLATCSW
jgi:hypothetical protein